VREESLSLLGLWRGWLCLSCYTLVYRCISLIARCTLSRWHIRCSCSFSCSLDGVTRDGEPERLEWRELRELRGHWRVSNLCSSFLTPSKFSSTSFSWRTGTSAREKPQESRVHLRKQCKKEISGCKKTHLQSSQDFEWNSLIQNRFRETSIVSQFYLRNEFSVVHLP
jgi:hypothetical protein